MKIEIQFITPSNSPILRFTLVVNFGKIDTVRRLKEMIANRYYTTYDQIYLLYGGNYRSI